MKIVTLILTSFISFCTIAQPLQIDWIETIPGSLYEQSNSIAQAPCGDIYVVGFFQEQFGNLTCTTGEDGFVAKYNPQGQLQWMKSLPTTGSDRFNGVAVLDDNQIFIAGEFKATIYYNNDSLESQDKLDALIFKMDSSGQVQWAISGQGTGFESANDIEVAPNGNLCITGYFESDFTLGTTTVQSSGLRDVFVASLDQNGNLNWLKSFGGPAFDDGRSIQVDGNSQVYITGSYRDFLYVPNDTLNGFGGYDVYLAKFDATGQFQWVKVMGGPASDEGSYVNVDGNQDIYIVGWYDRSFDIDSVTLTGAKEEDGFVAKFDGQGNQLWSKALAGNFDERNYAVDFDASNNVYVMGTLDSLLIIDGDSLTNRHLNRPTDVFIAKFDEQGDYKWAQALGHYYNDFCYDLHVENARTIYMIGSFQDTSIFVTDTVISQNSYDVYLVKFEVDTTVGIRVLPFEKESSIGAVRYYPNPSVNQSTLAFELKESTHLKISLVDVLGRELRIVRNEALTKGTYEIPILRENEASGIYYLKLESEETAWTVKVNWL